MRSAVAFLAVVALLLWCRVAAAKSQSLLKGTQGVQMDGVTVAWTLNDADNSVTFTAEGMPMSCVPTQLAAHKRVVSCAPCASCRSRLCQLDGSSLTGSRAALPQHRPARRESCFLCLWEPDGGRDGVCRLARTRQGRSRCKLHHGWCVAHACACCASCFLPGYACRASLRRTSAGRSAERVVPTLETLTDCAVAVDSGALSFRFTRLLTSSTRAVALSRNATLPLVWALFPAWEVQDVATDHPLERNIHPNFAFRATTVRLEGGNFNTWARPVLPDNLRPGRRPTARVIVAHAALMALAWGLLLPGGALVLRHAKHMQLRRLSAGDAFRLHVAVNIVAMVFMTVAFALSVQYTRVQAGAHFSTLHKRGGLALFILAWLQPLNGFARPPAGAAESRTPARRAWELLHAWFGRALVVMGLLLVLSGINEATDDGSGLRRAGQAVWVLWCIIALGGAALTAELATRRRRRELAEKTSGWVSMDDLS